MPPTQRPLRLEAAILSRMRSEVTSRSNWANDSSTFSVSRPIEVVGVELLGDRYEGHVVPVEQLDELGKIHQRSGQAVDLVDHDDVDPAGPHVLQEPLQGGPIGVAA